MPIENPKVFLASLPTKPGVYQMFNIERKILYVGKAKNLKRRISSYFREQSGDGSNKTAVLMQQVVSIEIIVTSSENEALLLENNLIKTLKPRYNILFKDDKSFPYLLITRHAFPGLTVFRGVRRSGLGEYFGPFPNVSAVRNTLQLLQRIFKLRQCQDNCFLNRSRPCLLYQIKRCSAPCVGYISADAYNRDVSFVKQLLNGENEVIMQTIAASMLAAAQNLEYEKASIYRDQITHLRELQQNQVVTGVNYNADVIAIADANNRYCLSLLLIRNGLVVGGRLFFPSSYAPVDAETLITTFIMQHYFGTDLLTSNIPAEILVNTPLPSAAELQVLFCSNFNNKVKISHAVRGGKIKLLELAKLNAVEGIKREIGDVDFSLQFMDLQKSLKLTQLPQKIACFDVSHSMGEATVAVSIVFDKAGAVKNEYRYVNIKTVNAGDDYGALRELLGRLYGTQKNLPDILLVDGGKGQLHSLVEVCSNLGIDNVNLMAIAKGAKRKAGLETIYHFASGAIVTLQPSPALFLFLQRIRDEAHNFAIQRHRGKLRRIRNKSTLEHIDGVGKQRRQLLLRHFGGLQGLTQASISDIAQVRGVSVKLATDIHEYLHR